MKKASIIATLTIVLAFFVIKVPHADYSKSTFAVECTNTLTFGFYAPNVLTLKNLSFVADPSLRTPRVNITNPDVDAGVKIICNQGRYPSDVDAFFASVRTQPLYAEALRVQPNYNIVVFTAHTPSYLETFGRFLVLGLVSFVLWIILTLFNI